jgi:hypothetical protein
MRYKSEISFVWDEEYLRYMGNSFISGGDTVDFIQDKTIEMITKAIKEGYIDNLVKVKAIDELK